MSIHRIYPSKSNTIASGVAYEDFNSANNPVTNLWYGGGAEGLIDLSLNTKNSISRHLLYFDLNELLDKFQTKEIMSGNVVSYKLKMHNCLPSDMSLTDSFNANKLSKYVATSFDLIAFAIDEFWDEGSGYDLENNLYAAKSNGLVHVTGYSNWNNSTRLTTWTEPGIFINPTASTSFYVTQHFDVGNENLDMDITPLVNNWLTGGASNNGIAIAYARPYETVSSNTRYIASFFTEKTNTAFKPYLEVVYDQAIKDDRTQFSNKKTNRLFLFTYAQNQPINYFSAGTVDIMNGNGVIVASYIPSQLQTGVYYIDLFLPTATPGEIYTDTWNDVTFSPGIDVQSYTQSFVVKPDFYNSNSKGINQYSIKTYGLDNNTIIDFDGLIRIYAEANINFTNNNPYVPYGLQYKLTMNQKDEIIGWTDANYTMIDNFLTYFFDLDTSWLLDNQTYTISFKINELGTKRVTEEKIYFRVLKNQALQ